MAANLDFDLEEFTATAEDDTPGIKSMRSRIRELGNLLKQTNQELDTFRSKERGATLQDLLKSKGVPEAAFGLYPKDAAATEEAVGEWVSTYGAAFGIQQAPSTTVPAETQQQIQRMQQASAEAPPPTPGDFNTILARIQNAKNKDELDAVYAEYGIRPA